MTVSLVLVVVMAALIACGVYLLLERSLTRVVLGF
ncbi:MAG: sodium:proton antiporter, partial [Micrococcales bacterium 32-70-13]